MGGGRGGKGIRKWRISWFPVSPRTPAVRWMLHRLSQREAAAGLPRAQSSAEATPGSGQGWGFPLGIPEGTGLGWVNPVPPVLLLCLASAISDTRSGNC